MNGTQKDNNTDMEKIYKSNNMEVEQFYKDLESKYNKALYRRILVKLVDGKKQCNSDHKNWLPEKIKTDRGWGNTFSFSIKHVDNLYVVDFDTKDLDGCKLWDLLDGCAFTETNKGFHKYVYIKNLPLFKNQQKVYFDTKYEIDLLKDNNAWETADRTITGDIMTFEWEDLKGYFNTKLMNFVDDVPAVESPPVTPPASVDEEFAVETIEIPKCSAEDMIKYLTNIKPRYDYDSWTKIGFIIYNNFDGDDEGLDIYVDYTKKDKEYYISYAKNYRNVNKELLYEKRKKYGKTETGKKSTHISLWKRRNVKLRDNETYDDLYNIYLNTTNCKDCNVLLVVGKRCKESKCLDHDHNTGYFRDIVCHSCNCKRR